MRNNRQARLSPEALLNRIYIYIYKLKTNLKKKKKELRQQDELKCPQYFGLGLGLGLGLLRGWIWIKLKLKIQIQIQKKLFLNDITEPIDRTGNENRHRRFPIHLWSSPLTNKKFENRQNTDVCAAVLCLWCHEQGRYVWRKCPWHQGPTFSAVH